MRPVESDEVKKTLGKIDIHQQWESAYRTKLNERFYEIVFDDLKQRLNEYSNGLFLDAGCGIGAHSIRLAQHGFSIVGIDFSEGVLSTAKEYIKYQGLEKKLNYKKIIF